MMSVTRCGCTAGRFPLCCGATAPSRNNLSHANKRRDAALAEGLFWTVLDTAHKPASIQHPESHFGSLWEDGEFISELEGAGKNSDLTRWSSFTDVGGFNKEMLQRLDAFFETWLNPT
jgi:hypothetical protein